MLMGNKSNTIECIKTDDGSKRFDPREQEAEFREKWEPVFMITDEENRQFCPNKQNEVNEFLTQHQELIKANDNIDLSRLTMDNLLIRPITLC